MDEKVTQWTSSQGSTSTESNLYVVPTQIRNQVRSQPTFTEHHKRLIKTKHLAVDLIDD